LGRVPDYSFAQYHTWFFLGSSTTIALVVYAAAIRTQLFLAVTTGLVLATGAISISPLSAGDKPNVLFILVDTLRRDHVGPYGNKVQTPAIVKLASEAVTFKNAVTVIPKTTASVSAIFTGRYPIHNGVRTLYDRLPDQQPTLAESFYADGYQTAAFVNNAWLSRGRGFSQGFEHYYGYYEIADTYGSFRYNSWVTLLDGLTVKNTEGFSGQTSSARLTDAALRYIEKNRDQPFLAYVHYFEPHWPYFPPNELAARYGAPADGRSLVNFIEQAGLERGLMIFQNSLPEEDNEAARRLYRAGLDALGLSEDTIVVFTADHGHSLGEHDYFFHHGEFLYETSLQIPMIVRWPEKLPAGTIIEQQAQSIDLAPTLYALADIETHFQMDGQNLTRYIADPKAKAADAFLESDVKMFAANLRRGLTGISGKIRALRTDRHKLILNPTHQGAVFELYDLERDPGETTDLATDPSYAPLLLTLQERLLAQIPAHEGGMLVKMGSSIEPTAQPDQNEIEMLRKLGYIE
jgi:arylsulfatase A-like enzyme